MIYRILGNTGLSVSQLGFGAMRLPMVGEGEEARVDREKSTAMIHRAFEAGVNYIDTAVMYCHHDSERAVGEALKGWRDKVVLSTKNHYYGGDEKDWWTNLENSLDRLQVDYIDIYNHHGVNWKSYQEHVEPTMSQWMRKARDQGMIKYICCSFHANNEALVNLVDSGYPEVITLQYNLLDRQLEEGIALAHEKGIGVVVMGPVGGGRLGVPSEVLSTMTEGAKSAPELALRFVLANPNVAIALSGMSTMEQVEENLAIASDGVSLAETDNQAIAEHLERLKKMADLYCTGCRYCLPCPAGVDIPGAFGIYNEARLYGLWDSSRNRYAGMLKSDRDGHRSADACTECGECEEKCPQNIPIRQQLKEVHEALKNQGE
ncbi:MAG: 4Fe-4S dicluster domain-containing protein [Nitrospiraceae bacterium]|nr:4Fe-4S dicluster domain-containing protein [Nitrospiraceae bacterium]